MNLGNSLKKIAANFNSCVKLYNLTGKNKPNCAGVILGTLKNKNASVLKKPSDLLSFHTDQKENFLPFLRTVTLRKNIFEPDQNDKIKIELPLNKTGNKVLELPLYIEKEIREPKGQKIIIKKAKHMLIIRREKMKKHKKKKHKKKFRIQIQKRKLYKKQLKENEFKKKIQNLAQELQNFSAEKYVNDMLEQYNWKKPVTHVRGFLAPDWVIKKTLQDEEEKRLFKERINECIKARK